MNATLSPPDQDARKRRSAWSAAPAQGWCGRLGSPALLVKMAATVDLIAAGRPVFGIGGRAAGWRPRIPRNASTRPTGVPLVSPGEAVRDLARPGARALTCPPSGQQPGEPALAVTRIGWRRRGTVRRIVRMT